MPGPQDVRIHGYLAASFLLEQEPGRWDVLVILDSGLVETPFVGEHAKRHLCLWFDDVVAPTEGKTLASQEDVAKALRFAGTCDKLLVSCRAGQSRSAALAYLALCQAGSAEDAVRVFDPTRHIPNRLIVELGDRVLGDPDVLDQFERWRSRHEHVSFSDHFDDIERELDALIEQGAVNRIE